MSNPDIPLIYRTYAERRVVMEADPKRYERIMAVQRRAVRLGLPIPHDEKIQRADGRQWAPQEHVGRTFVFAGVFVCWVLVLLKMAEWEWLGNAGGFLFFVATGFGIYVISLWAKGETN